MGIIIIANNFWFNFFFVFTIFINYISCKRKKVITLKVHDVITYNTYTVTFPASFPKSYNIHKNQTCKKCNNTL